LVVFKNQTANSQIRQHQLTETKATNAFVKIEFDYDL